MRTIVVEATKSSNRLLWCDDQIKTNWQKRGYDFIYSDSKSLKIRQVSIPLIYLKWISLYHKIVITYSKNDTK